MNTIDSSDIEFTFIDENNFNVIQVNSIGWKTETINILVKIFNDNIFNLYVNAERLNENCCSFTRYNEIRIENSEFEFDSEKGIYKILVE